MPTDWDARAYHAVSALQKWLADEALAGFHLEGGERVLDVGCGDGSISAEIAARVPRGSVLGIDASASMIEAARARVARDARPNLSFEVGDARELGFRDEFDVVVSFNALHWVTDLGSALSSIHAALRPGGRVLLQLVPRTDRVSIEDVIERTRRTERWRRRFIGQHAPFVHPTADEMRASVRRHHFEIDRLDVHLRAWDFGSRRAFAAFANATFVEWTRSLPSSEVDAFVDDVLDGYGRTLHLPSEAVRTFHFDQLRIVARRRDERKSTSSTGIDPMRDGSTRSARNDS